MERGILVRQKKKGRLDDEYHGFDDKLDRQREFGQHHERYELGRLRRVKRANRGDSRGRKVTRFVCRGAPATAYPVDKAGSPGSRRHGG